MEILDTGPGPRVGDVLQELLDRVLEEPALNKREKLRKMIATMDKGP